MNTRELLNRLAFNEMTPEQCEEALSASTGRTDIPPLAHTDDLLPPGWKLLSVERFKGEWEASADNGDGKHGFEQASGPTEALARRRVAVAAWRAHEESRCEADQIYALDKLSPQSRDEVIGICKRNGWHLPEKYR